MVLRPEECENNEPQKKKESRMLEYVDLATFDFSLL